MKTLKRSTQITALCVTALCVIMPVASADPDPAPPVDPVAVAAISPADQAAPPPPGPEGAVPPGNPSYLKTPSPSDETAPPPPGPEGAVPPGNTSYLKTPDGWELSVSGVNETLLPVLPLTTALSSREYLVGGTFIGSIGGSGKTVLAGGVLEAGYRIGCGITADNVDLAGLVSVNPNLSVAGLTTGFPGLNGSLRVMLRPGIVNVIPVTNKKFKGIEARTNIAGLRIKIDVCAGQSFIQSYATLTSSTTDTADITTYLGTVKVL